VTFEELVEKLAEEVKVRMNRGDFKRDAYGLCIHRVCRGSKRLKQAVGRYLNNQGQIAKAINKVKNEEAREARAEQRWLWITNIKPGPKYIEGAGIFMIPATPEWTDEEIKAATDRLVRERQLRTELAQLLEQNAGK
jgi:hypothetical protein